MFTAYLKRIGQACLNEVFYLWHMPATKGGEDMVELPLVMLDDTAGKTCTVLSIL